MLEKMRSNPIAKVNTLGPYHVEKNQFANYYLIHKKNQHLLVDLAPIHFFDQFKQDIEKDIPISSITHLVLMNRMLTTLHVITELIHNGFKGVIVTDRYLASQLETSKLNVDIYVVDDHQYQLKNGEEVILSFATIQFLPYPDMIVTFEPVQSILFPGLLFSSYQEDLNPLTDTDLQKAIFTFHKEIMPSSQFIVPALTKIEKLKPKIILPAYGTLLDESLVLLAMEWMRKMSFHNNYISNSKTGGAIENLDYFMLINQLIMALEKHYSRIEILNTFIGSAFNLDHETLTLKKTSLANYKMWHQFFDVVFSKKGMSWLIIMEPTLQHLMRTYGVELPSIYRTETMKLKEETRLLEEKRNELETHLSLLKQQIDEAKDDIVRDPLTKLYNQDMLKHMMKEHFQSSPVSGRTRGLLLIQLDQLQDINKRYSKETGDESVRNMVYVIDQVKDQNVVLFKQSGPGIFALVEDVNKKEIINQSIKFKNSIAESTSFIEKVSVSIAIVTCEELDPTLDMDEKVKYYFSTLEKRIAYAKLKGQSQIIDESIVIPDQAEGLILLVDQDELNRNMLYRIFKRINFDVVLADSVVEAFQLIQKRKIDVVISEINLSKMDGFQLKMMMNESKTYHEIPFIMVSHNKTIDNIRRGNLLDVDLILEKPIIPEELIGHVKRMKERHKS
ncbi:MAG: hypothetical protein A2Y45_01595 [Tenericutes bacterium GWC2_34_14]|nr:MAG: hypothetical protein A2Z84_01860 [Tenericutes bacterium GWA2_35_7]OHE28229.1 MAG: hypothetical protein A2Y45_01595 [Tenericutes bacterium GWC2_34_14]OHE33145.1 MAG: hypothetical protein A2012_00485 [Tenericutes bacterium GWE2_34_108]OHE36265.1 MAG: hypothetical protein A2Y46_07475 [Tenericutes bacterium GWF1_35_14]OHE38693.1 MAG: hypothetical protein A2Y44_04755 [Tenericutes bacterium GWF2_35_184]OHE44808.1 MAG: hypothetical protein A2221_01140 [Tenericutes bacterium RIFOXYA2_FULL_36_3